MVVPTVILLAGQAHASNEHVFYVRSSLNEKSLALLGSLTSSASSLELDSVISFFSHLKCGPVGMLVSVSTQLVAQTVDEFRQAVLELGFGTSIDFLQAFVDLAKRLRFLHTLITQ